MNILDKLVAATNARLQRDREKLPFTEVKERSEALPRLDFPFERALAAEGMSFICEVKRASPSKGMIAENFPYLQIAKDYEAAGASAISVLTETDYFLGNNEYLREIAAEVNIPVLRKDFTTDPYQIFQARLLGASAVLLIAAILDQEQLREYIAIADSLGMSALVEAHDEQELHSALAAGARIVGVNNRDLKTFTVDLNNSIRLRKMAPPEVLFVSESGVSNAGDVRRLVENKVNAVLVGESMMRSPDKVAFLRELRGY